MLEILRGVHLMLLVGPAGPARFTVQIQAEPIQAWSVGRSIRRYAFGVKWVNDFHWVGH